MIKSIKYVLHEHITNIYRIFSIAKYEILSDIYDSKLGLFWNFANPAIQIFTYWFVFGMGIRGNSAVDEIDFFNWMVAGLVPWFFIRPCITIGANSIYAKVNIITKMKFPISILPSTIVAKELFNHICMMAIVVVVFSFQGYVPTIHWLWLFYYMVCIVAFGISLGLITSVLTMITRDVKKFINASMQMLMYLTPILWTMDKMPPAIVRILKGNPVYYIVQGYRDSMFYHQNYALTYSNQTIFFWCLVIVLFVIGSVLMYKFKHRLIDMI